MSTTLSPPSAAMSGHFLFDEEHEQFRQKVRRFVVDEIDPHADEWDSAGRFPKELFARAGDLGLFGHSVPRAYGGLEQDCRMAVVMAEEMARARSRGVSMGLGAHCEIAMPHLVRFGTPEQKDRYLADLVAGRRVAALGVTEPNAGSNVAGLETTAVRDGNGWRLNGRKIFITNSLSADLFFVAAKTNPEAGHRGVSMFLVDRTTPGFEVEEMHGKLGRRSSDTGRLTFNDCRLREDTLLGEVNQGFYQIMQCFENERLVIAAGCVGGAAHILEETKTYVQRRKYGQGTLADMQVTKQRLARSYAELEAARQLTYYCCSRVLYSIPSLKEVAMAKAFCAEAGYRIVDDCLQLHGGYGYFDSSAVERAYRDMRLDRIGGGATEVMYDIIAKQIGI